MLRQHKYFTEKWSSWCRFLHQCTYGISKTITAQPEKNKKNTIYVSVSGFIRNIRIG